jgi:5,5'-dehydrodivanillate O-demethylase
MSETMTAPAPKVRSRPPQDFYQAFAETAPGTLGGKYLRQFWHPIAVSSELPPGRAKPIRLLSENFTLYRGETGTLHLTEFHCPHRRTQLSVGYVEGDAIRCLYHGWKFGADGACVERPAEPGSHAHVHIRTYGVKEFLGLIFAYTGDGPEPAFPPFPAFEEDGVVIAEEQFFECNHFQSWENDWDIYHAAWTHKMGELHGPTSGPGRSEFFASLMRSTVYEETDFGVVRTMSFPDGAPFSSVFIMPAAIRLMIPTFNELSRRGIGPSFRDTYLVHCPVDDLVHKTFITQIIPVFGEDAKTLIAHDAEVKKLRAQATDPAEVGRSILAGRTNLADHVSHPVFVIIEDTAAQVSQGVIVDRSKEMLGTSDNGVIYLRRLMARELSQLDAGLPTKEWTTQWKRPAFAAPEF